jgi:2-dehydropantoate 2-reductase
MKVLVYGAGVIGSYLCHVLCEAGNDVTLLARGLRKTELDQKGLIIRHYVQKKATVDHPRITEKLG